MGIACPRLEQASQVKFQLKALILLVTYVQA